MLRIHDALSLRRKHTAGSLAEAMEVSPETIKRDVKFMRDRLKLPIEFDQRKKTYRYTSHVAAFPTMKVTEGEVLATLVASKAIEQFRGTPYHAQLVNSFEKIAAALPDKVSFQPTDALKAISFKSLGLGKSDLAVFDPLSTGVVREVEVRFDYRKPGEGAARRRHVRPYHLAHRDNLWYLVGLDLERGALRTFALPRIACVELTAVPFKRPEDFSPEAYFASALSVFGGDGDYRIVIRFRGPAADRVREREWHPSQSMHTLENGELEVTLRLGALPEVERWALSWGAQARVMEPPELRERMRANVEVLAQEYCTPK